MVVLLYSGISTQVQFYRTEDSCFDQYLIFKNIKKVLLIELNLSMFYYGNMLSSILAIVYVLRLS